MAKKDAGLTWLNIKMKRVSRTLKFIGRKAAIWSALGILGTLLLAGVELGIAYFIPYFLRAVGLVDATMVTSSFRSSFNVPSWAIGLALIALGSVRFLGQYLVNQSGVAAQEGV
ncbi:MAG: hypothetical protein NTX25_23615, partial [Proteobacteria bacterium]|nr:hypothetical protein [Pseudomonadota bacterium]